MRSEFEINPKDFSKNWSLVIFFSIFGGIWGVGTIFGTISLTAGYSTGLLVAVLSCATVTTLTIVFLLTANSHEIISVADGYVVVSYYNGRRRTSIQIENLKNLLLEKSEVGWANLLLASKDGKSDLPIAPFVSLEDKRILLSEIGGFFRSCGVTCEIVDATKP